MPSMRTRTDLRKGIWVRLILLCFAAFLSVYAWWIEPRWLRVRDLQLALEPTLTIVHFSDIHYKGDDAFLRRVVTTVNQIAPDFACFTGDIVEDAALLEKALDILRGIRCPLYGCPGNHEYWSGASLGKIEEAFQATGGAWLEDREAIWRETVLIYGTGRGTALPRSEGEYSKRVLLSHYPETAAGAKDAGFDLMLAGHSHGGQVRLPLLGALIVPDGVGGYDRGVFETDAGVLYVSPGLGTWYIPVRFLCRPEITVVRF